LAVEVTMPRLSDQMEEGTVLRWVKAEGEEVQKGEELVEIETDKATWIVEAEETGSLIRILVRDGGIAPVGSVIGFIGGAGESIPAGSESETPGSPLAEPAQVAVSAAERTVTSSAHDRSVTRARATPVARRTARELRVALEAVAGTGPGGRIVRRDVLAAASAAPQDDGPSPTELGRGSGFEVELTATQRTIARRMAESTSTIPHFTVSAEIDMEAALALRRDLKELTPESAPSANDLVVKAVALALRDFPAFNASFAESKVIRWPRINVGIAVAAEDVLLVPVLFDVDAKPLAQIARETRDLADRARSRALAPAELSEGTFTVSNLGMLGVRSFSAVINPPQAAILAVGAVSRRAVVEESGEIVARHRMDVTLACDHRVVYGADAARFLARVRELLERPLALTL
jgi:pyruvate dehydrogenase E2 component (dihydrolipoamide acetyltransferase)